MKREGLKAELP